MYKKHLAKAIEIAGVVLGLVVAYQAIRFCQGAIGAPILDQITPYYDVPFATEYVQVVGVSNIVTTTLGWISKGFYSLAGITIWMMLGSLVCSSAKAVARIVLVGFSQYCDEVRAARAEAEIARVEAEDQARLADAREQRREQRRKLREAEQPKSGFSFTTLVTGVILGMILFK